MLGAIGLDDVHESAYRALVSLGSAGVPEVARRLLVDEEAAEGVLHLLERHGLAARSSARPGHWVAAPPAPALGALLDRHRSDLEQAERTAAQLAEEFRTRSSAAAALDPVEVVTGAGAVAQRFAQAQVGAGEELCVLAPAATLTATAAGRAAAPFRGGARPVHRVVVERAVFSLPAGLEALGTELDRPAQVRVTERVPSRLVIADRSLAVVPLQARHGEPSALVVRPCGLLDALGALFESVWLQSLPLRRGSGGAVHEQAGTGPGPTDLEILSLLLAGFTDASVAKQLELGLRTVQRRVKHLMDLSGVTTRLQLGWQAYERGWVARVPGQRERSTPGN